MEEQAAPRRRRVLVIEIIIIVLFAIIVDVLQFFLSPTGIAGTVIDVVFVIVLLLWFFITNRMNSQIVLITLVTFVGEAIPLVNALPFWTAEVIYLIYGINSGKIKTHSIRSIIKDQGRGLVKETATKGLSQAAGPALKGAKIPGIEKLEAVAGKKIAQKTESLVRKKLDEAFEDSTPSITPTRNTIEGYQSPNTASNQTINPVSRNTITDYTPPQDQGDEYNLVRRKRLGEGSWNNDYQKFRTENPNLSDEEARYTINTERRETQQNNPNFSPNKEVAPETI